MDEAVSLKWLEERLHPEGLHCPRCGGMERRLSHAGAFPGYRCRGCDRYHTILTGTAFEKTHQTPAKLVLLLRGIAKGETTSRLSRELDLSRKQAGVLRQRVQENLYEGLPTDVLDLSAFEADEMYQNAGEKRRQAHRPVGPAKA